MKKRIIPILLLAVALLTVTASARASIGRPRISFSGTTAYCEVIVRNAGSDISVTLELWNGGTKLATWTDSGKDSASINETYEVKKGEKYTLKGSCTIDGKSYTLSPVSATC